MSDKAEQLRPDAPEVEPDPETGAPAPVLAKDAATGVEDGSAIPEDSATGPGSGLDDEAPSEDAPAAEGTAEQADSAEPQGSSETPAAVPRPVRKKRRGLFLLGLVGLTLPFAALLTAIVMIVDRQLDAPKWMRTEIETRIAEALPGINVNFGRVSLMIERTGLARVTLWDVDIRNAVGDQVAALSDLEATLSPSGLLRGQTILRDAHLTGAFITLQRDTEGRFGLALGDAFAASTKSPSLTEIIARVDQVFQDPRLDQLRSIDADALTIRYEDARARRGWTADGGRLSITRDEGILSLAGDLALLGGGADVATLQINASSPIGQSAMDFGILLGGLHSDDIATQSPALAWLDALQAPISGALRSGLDANGVLGPLHASLQIGTGVLQPNASTRPIPFESAQAYFTYDPGAQTLRFSEIGVDSELGRASASGIAQLDSVPGEWPQNLAGQFRVTNVNLVAGALLDRSIEVKQADMVFQLGIERFDFKLGELRIADANLPISAKGRLIAASDGWDLSLDATADRLSPAQILSFWPADVLPDPRNWVAENIQSGVVQDLHYALRAKPGETPVNYLDLGFRDAVLTYNKRLPRIEKGQGRLVIEKSRLAVQVDAGRMPTRLGDGLDLAGSQFVIPDLRQRNGTAQIALKASGAVSSVLSYLDNDAWQVLRRNGRQADLATGTASIEGDISLPMKRGLTLDQVTLDLDGVLRNVKSETLVPGRVLASDRLEANVTSSAVVIGGPVTLSGVTGTGQWRQPLNGGNGKITAEVDLSDSALRRFGIDLPQGTISGNGKGSLVVDLQKSAPPSFSLRSNLAGIGLSIPPVGWRLGQGTRADLLVAGRLSQPARIDTLSLKGGGLDASGSVTLKAGGGLDKLALSRFKIGDWINAEAVLTGRGAGRAPAVSVQSGNVDLRSAQFGAGGGGGGSAAVPLDVALNRLRVSSNIVLRDFRGSFNTDGGLTGRFRASVGSNAPITGQVVPQNGGSAFRIKGEDAGDILRGAGILKTVNDGTFDLTLAPVRGRTGVYNGSAVIKGARLRNAPAIGSLLDAISIVGIIDQANGAGIYFDTVEAEFQLTPDQLILTRSYAVGPSMGISLDGYYNLASGQMDMQGVLSPIYFLNAIGRIIAREGEGLIGFNFNLQGTAKNPITKVNPLSLLTPGMFRDIFRRPPPSPKK